MLFTEANRSMTEYIADEPNGISQQPENAPDSGCLGSCAACGQSDACHACGDTAFSGSGEPQDDRMTVPTKAEDAANIPADPAKEQEQNAGQPDIEIIGIRFKKQGKLYYFDPAGFSAAKDDHVIVDTARGPEYGVVALSNQTVPAREVVQPLRKVIRIATEEDEVRYRNNLEKETEAFNICLEKIEEHKLDMKLVDVEYTFDNSKLLFYFTADGRVDFRDLVKSLASVFHTRIELRQIGIRDEAKMMGGLGVCGRPFCCASFLSDFVQVSIKMAKEQNLSLNSTKISGACGRLMCCLRYEHEAYLAETALTPKVDAVVITPDGEGIVTETSPLRGLCKVRLLKENDTSLKLYHRDDLKPTDKTRKDLPVQPERRSGEHAEERPEKPERPRIKPKRRESLDAPPVSQNTETERTGEPKPVQPIASKPVSGSEAPKTGAANKKRNRPQRDGNKENSKDQKKPQNSGGNKQRPPKRNRDNRGGRQNAGGNGNPREKQASEKQTPEKQAPEKQSSDKPKST